VRDLVDRALSIAVREIGIREVGRNRGPRVEEYLASVGLPPGNPWCAAFVHWCFARAAEDLERERAACFDVLAPRTGGVHKMWRRIPEKYRQRHPTVGALFFHNAGAGMGHVGFVKEVLSQDRFSTVEGNTDDVGSREGDGVRSKSRPGSYVNLGFVDFARDWEPAVA